MSCSYYCVILSVLAILAFIIFLVLYYYGFFTKIIVKSEFEGPFLFAYKKFTGQYRNVGPVFQEVFEELKEKGIDTTQGLGLYYDNPEKIEDTNNCRSLCGSVVPESKAEDLKGIEGIKFVKIPKSLAVVVSWPYKGILSMIFGIRKVYPYLQKYFQRKKLIRNPCIELYDHPKKEMKFIWPNNIKPDFFVNLMPEEKVEEEEKKDQ